MENLEFTSWQQEVIFPLLQNVQTSSGAHQASYSMDTKVLSRGPISKEVKVATHVHLVPRL
jgi:hypothetical protein